MPEHAYIQVELDLDLRLATRRRGDAGELKLSEEVVVLGESALALVHLDQDHRLVVGRRREDLRLAGGDLGVAGDELGHDTAGGFL